MLVGNSLGGYASLVTAAYNPDLVSALVVQNGAGPFRKEGAEAEATPGEPNAVVAYLSAALQRVVLGGAFYLTRTPQRIKQVLTQVYPIDASNVDDDLVASIEAPAYDADACEVFYRIVSKASTRPDDDDYTVEALVERLEMPLNLMWGMSDVRFPLRP